MRMKWAMQLAEGMVAMHAAGIIHRKCLISRLLLNAHTGDIRAVNVLLTYDYDVKISGKAARCLEYKVTS